MSNYSTVEAFAKRQYETYGWWDTETFIYELLKEYPGVSASDVVAINAKFKAA